MTAVDIAKAFGGDVIEFDYAHLDLAHVENLMYGSWGLYHADGTVNIGVSIAPGVGTDGITSQAGTYTTSISLAHLDAFTSAHVNYDGSGFTLTYTLDGGVTWTALAEDGVIPLLPANADLDLKVAFAGGVANDPSILNRLTVFILKTETILSDNHARTLTFSADPITPDGMVVDANITLGAADTTGSLDPNGPAQVGAVDYNIGTIELWINPVTGTIYPGAPNGTLYVNGVANGTIVPGQKQHIVGVFDIRGNYALNIAPGTLSHLAVYPQQMTANDVATLYAANMGPLQVVVSDSDSITVTEPATPTDIYAYAWSIVSGGTS
jgi:hypothetical protein